MSARRTVPRRVRAGEDAPSLGGPCRVNAAIDRCAVCAGGCVNDPEERRAIAANVRPEDVSLTARRTCPACPEYEPNESNEFCPLHDFNPYSPHNSGPFPPRGMMS